MIRQLMKSLVGEEVLSNMTAKGKSDKPCINPKISDAIKQYVMKNSTKDIKNFTRTVNLYCSSLGRKKKQSIDNSKLSLENTMTSKKREFASVSSRVKHKKLCTEKINSSSSSSEFSYSESQSKSIEIDSENDSEEDTGVPEQVRTPSPKTPINPSETQKFAKSLIPSNQNQETPYSPFKLYPPTAPSVPFTGLCHQIISNNQRSPVYHSDYHNHSPNITFYNNINDIHRQNSYKLILSLSFRDSKTVSQSLSFRDSKTVSQSLSFRDSETVSQSLSFRDSKTVSRGL
ncbi:serine-rich adhesin for platelets-like [Microplitis mediator]|uniref:serine-rich adhesin for platelets-like n=1 Tax=Microplitis mediator TaxID=375433 RepID=UPI0025557CCE|nr:serine-rich adhesin for platelets-like [Microplitis mediator]